MTKPMTKSLDEYIEFAKARQCHSDAYFYNEIKDFINAQQAKIDSLMFEYCPDEMTKDQVNEWSKHQVKADIGDL